MTVRSLTIRVYELIIVQELDAFSSASKLSLRYQQTIHDGSPLGTYEMQSVGSWVGFDISEVESVSATPYSYFD